MNRIFNSDINSLSSWTPTNFITKQIKQDFPRGLARLNTQIIAFGDETMEIFVNAGNASGSPLQVEKSMFKKFGLSVTYFGYPGGTHYYATLGGKIFFVGREAGGTFSLSLFVYDGSTVQKASTVAIDKILSQESQVTYSVSSIGILGRKAIAIALDPPTATTQRWLMFFPDWNEWFEWNSTVFTPVNNGERFFGVGTNQHRTYYLGLNVYQDDTVNYTWTHQFKLPKNDLEWNTMTMCGVIGDTARSASTLNVEFSDDDWQSFQTIRTIDMTKVRTKRLFKCGTYSDRGIRLTHIGNVDIRLQSFIARIN